MDPGHIYGYKKQKKIIFFRPEALQQYSPLFTDALVATCSLLKDLGTQQALYLQIPKGSCIIA